MGKPSRWTSEELRQAFLEFFRDRGHPVLPASPLAPHDDPTLLFTTAGMVQFKPYYAATGPIPYRRAATCQPCLRGTDLENVGVTTRHHTFFEMLGNFSFGDYFKEEAIRWAWEFSTEVLKLPEDRLWASVYEDDDEAYEIWEKGIGLDARRIVRLGAEDNFWGPAGDSGACGPCSELYLDMGEERSCGKPVCAAGCDCDRYLEFWNLVFPQFNQTPEGERLPLPNRGVDTGLGLERLVQVMQGSPSNFETDLLLPVVEAVGGYARGADPRKGEGLVAVRIIADHVRALTFAINEAILPGNEGRGYVLRRILRRALLRANRLGVEEIFLDKIADVVIEKMKGPYPDLERHKDRIGATIRAEEERFRRTLEQGLEIFRGVVSHLRKEGADTLPGGDIFRLYDTYGFPVELTEEMALAEGLRPDREGFDAAMGEQRDRSQWATGGGEGGGVDLSDINTTFVGYDRTEEDTEITAIVKGEERVEALAAGDEGALLLRRTPFYGESGGQVGDMGHLEDDSGEELFLVHDATKSGDEGSLLRGKALRNLRVGEKVRAVVERERRLATARNHTATHLLHRALREVLGDHVRQAGSLVDPERLRFDFVHFSRATEEELGRVEALVNRVIQEDRPVEARVVPFEEATRAGAMALFGEKYGEHVRMVSVREFSRELCGGTHVSRTGEIGPFLITAESAIGSGIRRIEALTGAAAFRKVQEERAILAHLSGDLRVGVDEVLGRVQSLRERVSSLEKELSKARQGGAGERARSLWEGASSVEDIRVVAQNLGDEEPSVLKDMVDWLQAEAKSTVAVLGTRTGGKAFLVGMVSRDLVGRGLSAGDLIARTASIVGGRGGGKETFAQAGGKDPDRLDEALGSVPGFVREMVEGG